MPSTSVENIKHMAEDYSEELQFLLDTNKKYSYTTYVTTVFFPTVIKTGITFFEQIS
jgi:hypothetical protein